MGGGSVVRSAYFCRRPEAQFPASTWWFTAICNFSSRGPDPYFCAVLALHACGVLIGRHGISIQFLEISTFLKRALLVNN